MADLVRAFIAIEIPGDIQKRLDEIIRRLNKSLNGIPIRWVKAGNIHLTLKFLGDVSITNLKILENMLLHEASGHSFFELSVGDLGAFPNNRRARVIWVNVSAPTELAALQHTIEVNTTRLGYLREERPFSPHLTLGRVGRNANTADLQKINEALLAARIGFIGAARVEAIKIFKSDLQPGGSIYTCLYSAPLVG